MRMHCGTDVLYTFLAISNVSRVVVKISFSPARQAAVSLSRLAIEQIALWDSEIPKVFTKLLYFVEKFVS